MLGIRPEIQAAVIAFAASILVLWLTLRHQHARENRTREHALRDRHRAELRQAFELLLKAGQAVDAAATELRTNPQGHPPTTPWAVSDHDPYAAYRKLRDQGEGLKTEGLVGLTLVASGDDEAFPAWLEIEAQAIVFEITMVSADATEEERVETHRKLRESIASLNALARARIAALDIDPKPVARWRRNRGRPSQAA